MTELFRRSYEVQTLITALSAMSIGDTASYAALSEAVGKPVAGCTPALTSARSIVEKERGYVFGTLYRQGIKRLADAEIVQASHANRTRISRAAKKSLRHLGSIKDFTALPPDLQRTHTAHMTVMAVIAENASRATIKRLEIAAQPDPSALLAHLAGKVA